MGCLEKKMKKRRVLGIDPAYRHFAWFLADFDLDTGGVTILDWQVIDLYEAFKADTINYRRWPKNPGLDDMLNMTKWWCDRVAGTWHPDRVVVERQMSKKFLVMEGVFHGYWPQQTISVSPLVVANDFDISTGGGREKKKAATVAKVQELTGVDFPKHSRGKDDDLADAALLVLYDARTRGIKSTSFARDGTLL